MRYKNFLQPNNRRYSLLFKVIVARYRGLRNVISCWGSEIMNERDRDLSEEWNLIIGYYDQLVKQNAKRNKLCVFFIYRIFFSLFSFCTQKMINKDSILKEHKIQSIQCSRSTYRHGNGFIFRSYISACLLFFYRKAKLLVLS